MHFVAGIIFGAAASAIGCGVWAWITYREVIERFTTEGEGVHIMVFGERRVAMVELD